MKNFMKKAGMIIHFEPNKHFISITNEIMLFNCRIYNISVYDHLTLDTYLYILQDINIFKDKKLI